MVHAKRLFDGYCTVGAIILIGTAWLLAISSVYAQEKPGPSTDRRMVIEGTVYDEASVTPIPHVTVQITAGGQATKTNRDGRYRLILRPAAYDIKVSHVGYYSQTFRVTPANSNLTRDVYLKISVYNLGERKVYTRAYDPAQRIIAEAIRRKKDILSQIHDYSFDAYSRLVLKDADKPDSENIFMITESKSTSYWEQPDKYKEVITGRQQSANLPAEGNLVAVGQMLNFNRNRIELGRYDVVSPTAHDAMDHYNYYLLDTVYIDGKGVFVLEVEPKNEYSPLFVGEIQIADSTYDVVKVDVGFSKGFQIPLIDSAHYYQSMASIDGRCWLPIEIGLSGLVTFDVPIPGIPRRIDFAHIASIYQYRIDSGHAAGTFGEYDMEVDAKADEIDSVAWAAARIIPLTGLEVRGYERIDSLEHAPKPIYKHALKGLAAGLLMLTFGQHDLFHFNRVEGPYAGAGVNARRWIPNTRLRLKTGYSFDDELWQYECGVSYRLWEKQKLWIGAFIKDEIVHRPTEISRHNHNATFNALFFKFDPFDYYREKGISGYFSVKPINQTRLSIGYNDFRQLSQSKTTDYGFFRRSITPRENPSIINGRLRSVRATLSYDSRKLIKNKDEDLIMGSSRYIRVEAGLEYASPRFIDNDFDFRRYHIQLVSRLMFGGLGITRLRGMIGSSDGSLPPQKYFIVDFHDPNFFKTAGFNSVGEDNFGGDRMASVYAIHDFGTHLFRNSGDRYLKKIPFGLTIHGGAMWTEFKRRPTLFDPSLREAPTVFGEAGFGLSNLTPFLMPFNLSINFTWHLSDDRIGKFYFLYDFRL